MPPTRSPTTHRGARHHRSKHSDATVQAARQLRKQGLSYTKIGRQLNVNWRTVADWVNYATRYTQ